MIAAILCAMALADGAFSGFRSWAGRDGRIVKRHVRIRSSVLGAALAAAALVVIGLAALIVLKSTQAEYADLVAAGREMALVYAPLCLAVGGALLGYFSRRVDIQALATMVVLGPVTLARPVVIIGGALVAAWGSGPAIATLALFAASVMLAVEPMLSVYWRRELRSHPFT